MRRATARGIPSVTYLLEGKEEQSLRDTTFAVVALRRYPEAASSHVADAAVVKVRGDTVLEKYGEDLPVAPPRSRGGRKRVLVSRFIRFLGTGVIASFDLMKDLRLIEWICTCHGFDRAGNESISLRRLARFLLPDLGGHDLASVAAFLGVRFIPEEGAAARAEASGDVLIELLRLAGGKGIGSFAGLKEEMDAAHEPIEWDRYAFDRNLIDYLPPSPGVYMMKDREGKVIYVGKALSLRERVIRYFTGREEERIRGLRGKLFDIEYERTGTVLTALLREAELITALRPEFNTMLAGEMPEGPRRIRVKKSAGKPGRRRQAAAKLLFLPSVTKEEIDLILVAKGRPVWKGMLHTDLSNLSAAVQALAAALASPAPLALGRSDALELSLVESWLSRNEDAVNLIELDGGEDEATLEKLIRPLVESGDWNREKVVYRM
jgi:hypothetical protein